MQLLTVVGAHAGEVREYTFLAAQDALRAGMAEPVRAPHPQSVEIQPTSTAAVMNHTGRRRAARSRE